jgi:tripartite ATP-independent transporter DctP family solute receptor
MEKWPAGVGEKDIDSVRYWKFRTYVLLSLLILSGCVGNNDPYNNGSGILQPRISMVNSPADIVTLGGKFIAQKVAEKSGGKIQPKVYHSGVLSGGKGSAEIELCQQGSIEIHITTTAYLANLVPKTSVVSLPFLFRDIDQVIGLVKSDSRALEIIDQELNEKNLKVIAWWPRGFRQLTNNKRPVKQFEDLKDLKLRVMTNQLFVDNMNAMGAHPVPMAWGEVYNGLQLNTIDGQENAEDVIFSSRLYEVQQFMTVWDYSTDIEVVLVNLVWWNGLPENHRQWFRETAVESVSYEVELLKKNTEDLRAEIAGKGVSVHYLAPEEKVRFRQSVRPVWEKYEEIFTSSFLNTFLSEIRKY